jgi:hypothetical protein
VKDIWLYGMNVIQFIIQNNMNIDFENPQLMFKLTKYFGEMEDGRTFAIVVRSSDDYDSVEDIETDDDEFTQEELADIEKNFYDSL